ARFATPEANPARVSGMADIASPTAGPVLNASPAPVNTKPASSSTILPLGPASAYTSMPAAIKTNPVSIGNLGPGPVRHDVDDGGKRQICQRHRQERRRGSQRALASLLLEREAVHHQHSVGTECHREC